MNPPEERLPAAVPLSSDATFHHQVERLYRLTLYGRWLVIIGLWLTIGSLSLWGLRDSIALMHDYFTWAALRYGLLFNLMPALGLVLCLSVTISTLVWQSCNAWFGLSTHDRGQLEQQVQRIRQQGASHPLWNYLVAPPAPACPPTQQPEDGG